MREVDPLAPRAACSTRGRARLRAVYPETLRWSLLLPEHEHASIVGRVTGDEVRDGLAHGTVSRRHLAVRWDAATQRHLGRDLGSHNGSRVDGQDVGTAEVPLHQGSVLRIGDVCVVYERFDPGLEPPPVIPTLGLDPEPLPGQAPGVVALREAIAQIAVEASPVLLRGEPGTSPEPIAEEIHRRSQRPGPLACLRCSTLDPQRLDAALFGQADPPGVLHTTGGGTLFLDAIDALPRSLQPTLLTALTPGEGSPRVRLVAATAVDLAARVHSEIFDRDLYAWLSPGELRVPPLRERRGDILAWIERLHTTWIDQHPEHEGDPLTLTPEAAELLLLHDWPGNLQQLERLVHELACDSSIHRPIAREWLPQWLHATLPRAIDPRDTVPATPPVR